MFNDCISLKMLCIFIWLTLHLLAYILLKLKNCGTTKAVFYTTMFTEYTRNFSQRPLKTPDLWFGRTKSSIELQPVERKVGIEKVSNLKTVVTCLLQN